MRLIQRPELLQPVPAKILKGLKNEQFKENDTIVLKALIAGYPFPRVSSLKPNRLFSSHSPKPQI